MNLSTSSRAVFNDMFVHTWQLIAKLERCGLTETLGALRSQAKYIRAKGNKCFTDAGREEYCQRLGALYQDVRPLLKERWAMVIAFPPCTHLAVSGARWFKEKQRDGRQQRAINFFMEFVRNTYHIPHVAIENPIGIMSTKFTKPSQIIQPWQFGHGETKATCLWLSHLPLLQPTNIVDGREARIHKLPPTKDRAALRSKTYPGIAKAMAEQWGAVLKGM